MSAQAPIRPVTVPQIAARKNDQPIFRSVDQQSVDPTTLPRRDQTIYRFQILARMATEGSTAR